MFKDNILEKDTLNWKRMQFKKNKVWLALDKDGAVKRKNGKVLIKYQVEQDHEYWVHETSVIPIDEHTLHKAASKNKKPSKAEKKAGGPSVKEDYNDKIRIFTDGACSGNPGPAGIGVFLKYGSHEKEISEYIGIATNNIAELTAIKRGLEQVKKKHLPVRVFTDSSYSLGLLARNWKPKKNKELVASIRKLMKGFKDLDFIKVKGHSGLEENEKADRLAVSAITKKA